MASDRPPLTAEIMAGLIEKALADDELSQAEFARRVGVSPKHVNQVLRGRSGTPLGQLDYWAYILGRRFTVDLRAVSTGEDPLSGGQP